MKGYFAFLEPQLLSDISRTLGGGSSHLLFRGSVDILQPQPIGQFTHKKILRTVMQLKSINHSTTCLERIRDELVVRVFGNGSVDRSSIPGRFIPKTQKMVLDATLLNTQHYKVGIKGKVEQSTERCSALVYT